MQLPECHKPQTSPAQLEDCSQLPQLSKQAMHSCQQRNCGGIAATGEMAGICLPFS